MQLLERRGSPSNSLETMRMSVYPPQLCFRVTNNHQGYLLAAQALNFQKKVDRAIQVLEAGLKKMKDGGEKWKVWKLLLMYSSPANVL